MTHANRRKSLPKVKLTIQHSADIITLMHEMLSVVSARKIIQILGCSLATSITLDPWSKKNNVDNCNTFEMIGYINKNWDLLIPKAKKYFEQTMNTNHVCGTCKKWKYCKETEGWRIKQPCSGTNGVKWEPNER